VRKSRQEGRIENMENSNGPDYKNKYTLRHLLLYEYQGLRCYMTLFLFS